MTHPISDEFQSILNGYEPDHQVSVTVLLQPDEETKAGIDERIATIIGTKRRPTAEQAATRSERLRRIRQYSEEAVKPLLGYLADQGKEDGTYFVNHTLGSVTVGLTRDQIYEVAELDNVNAILENQAIRGT